MNIGLIINPVAGIGGSVGLKGSDGAATQTEAQRRGATAKADQRLATMFDSTPSICATCGWLSAGGTMGADALRRQNIAPTVVYEPASVTRPEDTRQAARRLQAADVDLILFVGGDGTARDVLSAIGDEAQTPVLGLPAGVKMHSGVFATSPRACGEVIRQLVEGGLVAARRAEVRDVDEQAARENRAASRYYGTLRVPEVSGFVQHTKVAGRENDELALEEIIYGVTQRVDLAERPVVFAPGGSIAALERALGQPKPTLLGVDVRFPEGTWQLDVGADTLQQMPATPLLILSFPRGQGILLGRGNQQLSPGFLRRLNPAEDILLVSTRTKLAAQEGRPLLLDTGDAELDRMWSGLWEVMAGDEDYLFHRVERA